jgi:hypothetical protein
LNIFDPTRAMNAFSQGAQLGEGLRQRQTQSRLAPMVARGDFQAAAQFAGERGDLEGAEMYRSQYADQIAQMDEQTKAQAAQRADTIARTAASLQRVPYAQRVMALQQSAPMLQSMGIDAEMLAQFDPTDEAIQAVIAQATPLADLLKAQQPYTLAPGAVRMQGSEMIASNPKGDSLPSGMRMGANGPEWIPGYLEGQKDLRGAGATRLNVTNTLGGASANQYEGLPDGTFIEPPPGTANLSGGQAWVIRNGRPTIESIEGGPAASQREEDERKRLGRQASTQRAGATVVREVGRGLELMPKIVGWGDSPAGGETETTGMGEIAGANARLALSKIAGTAEYQFMQNIESALSNVGLDTLQAMRDNSPTGGALGQVPFQQQQRLEQVLGAFKITMPRPVIEENLKYLNNAYMDIMYGSRAERQNLMRQGLLTAEQNAQIDAAYYDLNWDQFGRMRPPAAAIDALRSNPSLREQFEAKYGQGSAEAYLGGQ